MVCWGQNRQLGVMMLDNQSGSIVAAGNVGSAKSALNSTGDMELICDLPPVEFYRVGSDTNAMAFKTSMSLVWQI